MTFNAKNLSYGIQDFETERIFRFTSLQKPTNQLFFADCEANTDLLTQLAMNGHWLGRECK